MDLGATICTPKKPACVLCPWMDACVARVRGDQETFPRKAAKVEGKLRRGASFVVTRADGRVLVRSRPTKGLLGGMTEVPSTAWSQDFDGADALAQAPLQATWHRLPGAVEHGFTHFPLRQSVYVAKVPAKTRAPAGMRWVPLAELHGEALPNVMRKVVAHAGLTPPRLAEIRRACSRCPPGCACASLRSGARSSSRSSRVPASGISRPSRLTCGQSEPHQTFRRVLHERLRHRRHRRIGHVLRGPIRRAGQLEPDAAGVEHFHHCLHRRLIDAAFRGMLGEKSSTMSFFSDSSLSAYSVMSVPCG